MDNESALAKLDDEIIDCEVTIGKKKDILDRRKEELRRIELDKD